MRVEGYHPSLESVDVTLHNGELWREFHKMGNEMIITKTGRRMFPYLRLEVKGLERHTRYFVLLEMSPASNNRYKFSGAEWISVGPAEPHLPPQARFYIHPDSPATGDQWSSQHILLNKVKLTNNTLDRSGNIILNSMHKYQPRIHIVMASDVLAIHWSPSSTFLFPETEFMAVTAYQNDQVTKLKIDNNPFAKGFRDPGVLRSKKRKAEQLKEQEEKNLQSSTLDDSGISSLGSPTPPVTTSPATSCSDCHSPPMTRSPAIGYNDCHSPPMTRLPAIGYSDWHSPPVTRSLAIARSTCHTPPVTTSPSIAFSDGYTPMSSMFMFSEMSRYLYHPLLHYPYYVPPPPLYPSYPSPYFPYLMPPFQPPNETFLMDLSVRRDSITEK